MAYHGAGQLGDAIAAFKQALVLEPDFVQALYNLGNAQLFQGHCDQAIETLNQCLTLDPDYAQAHWNLSHALLLSGLYEQGWTHYAWRRHPNLDIQIYPYVLKGTAWEGHPFPDQRLLVHFEQGYGDSIQLDSEYPDQVIWGGSLDAFPSGRHQIGPVARFAEPRQVLWANGACMIFRREMIQDIGLLDKNLIFLASDSDYSFTARARGWELWCITAARGRHEHGASGAVADPFIQNLKIKDTIYFGKKWLTGDLYKDLSFEKHDAKTEEQIMTQLRQALI